jgi:hypothetical protein
MGAALAENRPAGNGLAAIVHDLAAVLALGMLGRMAEAELVADEAEQAARVGGNPQILAVGALAPSLGAGRARAAQPGLRPAPTMT